MDHDTISGDLETVPSSSSDSGLSSAFSLSCEQQLSPHLPMEEDQTGTINSCLNSPQNNAEFDYLDSPNESVDSVDSPDRSVVNSNFGSPIAEGTEEMDYQQTFVTIVNPQVVEDANTETMVEQNPVVNFGKLFNFSLKRTSENFNFLSLICGFIFNHL